ncbi:hypothetical protein T484DRAFT_1867101 [Baffinella frigidus]|nr:hypothetical protein T484DRAFT_1867101 [Cryptophyta sp. CCMP2293]
MTSGESDHRTDSMVAHKCRALHPALSTPLVVLALAIALPHVTANLQDKLAKVKQDGFVPFFDRSYPPAKSQRLETPP